jgi:hypothetical protein
MRLMLDLNVLRDVVQRRDPFSEEFLLANAQV